MAVFLSKRWRQQPQGPVQIDWSNPLAQDLAYANLLGVYNVDLVQNVRATTTGAKRQPRQYGVAHGFGSTLGTGATDVISTQSTPNFPRFTASVLAYRQGQPAYAARLFAGGSGISTSVFALSIGATDGVAFFYTRLEGGFFQWDSETSGNVSNNAWTRATLSMDSTPTTGTLPKYYTNGIPRSMGAAKGAGALWATNAGGFTVGNRLGSDRVFEGVLQDFFIWRRLLTDAEAYAQNENPYQILLPFRPIIYSLPVDTGATLLPDLVTNNQTFYSPTVARGTVTLQPSLYTNAQTFYSPTVVRGTVTLQPSLYTNGQTFYSPAVARGTVTLQPSLYSNGQTFFAPTVTGGAVTLLPSLYTNGQTFYSPTVAAGVVTLQPSLYTNGQTFFAPSVTSGALTLLPSLYTNGQTFFTPTIAGGVVTLQPALYTNTSIFYAPSIAQAQTLSPALFVNTNTFFSPSLGDLVFDIYRLLANRQELDPVAGKFRVYKDDDVTVFLEADAWEDAAGTIKYKGGVLRRIDRLEPL